MIMWNHHAFNLTDEDGKLEAWLNFDFAGPDEQVWPAQIIFNTDQIFRMNVPVFTTQEVCSHQLFPPNTKLTELSSHMHQRGKRFRIFEGAWRCADGPQRGQACSPLGVDFESPDLCGGGTCASTAREHVGDCDRSGQVSVSELVTSVNWLLESSDVRCDEVDSDLDGRASINELVRAVRALLEGVPPAQARDAEGSVLYHSTIYNDPIILRFNPPMPFPNTPVSDDLTLTWPP
jgi:hypothetical protein